MTTTHAAAQAELTHAGRPISQEELDRWFRGPNAPIWENGRLVRGNGRLVAVHEISQPLKFDPTAQISGLARRLFKVSNAASFSGLHRDGAFDEVGASRHGKFQFHWGR